MYLSLAPLLFLAFFSFNEINNFREINPPEGFDSHPGNLLEADFRPAVAFGWPVTHPQSGHQLPRTRAMARLSESWCIHFGGRKQVRERSCRGCEPANHSADEFGLLNRKVKCLKSETRARQSCYNPVHERPD